MGGGRLVAILYKGNETNFTNMGLGPLNDAVSILVTEERNGIFELEMKYPVSGERFKELKMDRLIKSDAGTRLKDQRFKIIRITKPKNGIITVYAEHISYLTQDLALRPKTSFQGDAQTALNTWKASLVDANPFIVSSDITTTGSGNWSIDKVENPRRALGGVEGSLLDVYGGEYLFDNHHIRLMTQRGVNSGALIAYGKNLTDLTQEESIAETYTSVYPFAVIHDGQAEKLLTIPEYFVDSEHVNKYSRRKILSVDFSDKEPKSIEQLRSLTKQYITANDVGIPKVNLKLSYIDLSKTLDYKDLKLVEEVSICDNVPVLFQEMGINTKAKVIKTIWNDLTKMYDSIELGEARSTLSQALDATVDGKLETITNRLNTIQVQADGNKLIYRQSERPPDGTHVGDLWYQPNGEFDIMHQWDGTDWREIFNTADLNTVQREVTEVIAQADLDRLKIEDALLKADQSIIDAGFAQFDAAAAKDSASDALLKAVEAKTGADASLTKATEALTKVGSAEIRLESLQLSHDALTQTVGLKADSTVVSGLKETVESHTLGISANASAVGLKADKTLVDTINQTVTKHTLDIKAANDGLALKAEKTIVDNLKGTVDTHTNQISANAQAISVRLTSAQVDSLVTGKGYATTTELNATSSSLGLSISEVSTRLDNVKVGGRNYYRREQPLSKITGKTSLKDVEFTQNHVDTPYGFYVIGIKGVDAGVRVEDVITENGQWTISFEMRGNQSKPVRLGLSIAGGEPIALYTTNNNVWKKYEVSAKVTDFSDENNFIDFVNIGWAHFFIKNIKIEKGTVPTDWTPAPEDMATVERMVSVEFNLNGLQTTVSNKADKSQITQLSTQISSKVESATYNTKMTQLDNAINLRAEKGNLIAQINVSPESILIASNKIRLAGDTIMDTAFVNRIKAIDISADRITTGTFNAAVANLINVNVSSLVGNRSEFVRSAWNGIGAYTQIEGGFINLIGSDYWRRNILTGTGLELFNGSGASNKAGAIGYFKNTILVADASENVMNSGNATKHSLGIGVNASHNFAVGYGNIAGTDRIFDRAFQIDGRDGLIRLFRPLVDKDGTDKMELLSGPFRGHEGMGWFAASANRARLFLGERVFLESNTAIDFYGYSGTRVMTIEDKIYARRNIEMLGYTITGQSDRRLKNVFGTTSMRSLEAISTWSFVDYEWIDKEKPGGIQFGLIAQDTPEISVKDEISGMYSLDIAKQNMMNSHAIQQLNSKVVSIQTLSEASQALVGQALGQSNQALSEVQKLKQEVQGLKQKIQKLESAA